VKTGTVLGIGCAVLIVCGLICAGVLGFAGWFGLSMITEMNDTADSFLKKVGSGDYQGAYNEATADWRQRETLEQFTAVMKKSAVSDFSSVAWTSWKGSGNRMSMEGTMTTKSGQTGPVYVTLIKEANVWKVTAASSDMAFTPKVDDGKK
jgi:hypothetical protein